MRDGLKSETLDVKEEEVFVVVGILLVGIFDDDVDVFLSGL